MRKREIASILPLLFAIAAFAQSDSLHIPSMQEVYRQNSWLEGANPVGLSFNRFRSFSVAEAGYRYHNGNFGNLSIPASAHKYNVYSESFQTLGKVALYGKLGYANHQKQDINWNGMTGDYWRGINLCDSVNGNQSAEQYQLAGAFSLPVSTHWLIAAQFEYLVELTAKDTDPRNKNQWMEWKITPGAGYRWNEHLRLGASLLYAKRKEEVGYQNIGTHVVYPFLVAYPLGFFKTLPRGENINWYYSANEMGGALQVELAHGSFRLFQQVSGSTAGQDIISNRIQNKKEGETDLWEVEYKGKLQRTSPRNRHDWIWSAAFNGSSSYDPLQQQEASGTWTSYGKVLRSTHNTGQYALSYGYYRLRNDWNTRFSFTVGADYQHAKSSLFFYPTEYTQSVHRYTIHSAFTQNFSLKNGWLDCSLGGKYGKGGGDMMNREESQEDQDSPDITLWQNQDRLEQDFCIQTKARWSIQASATYTHTIPFTWFVRLSGAYEKANEMLYNTNKKYFSAQIGLLF
ncbi:DUF6850 family outer membrane beta-barrel protein [Phocaeicola sp.]